MGEQETECGRDVICLECGEHIERFFLEHGDCCPNCGLKFAKEVEGPVVTASRAKPRARTIKMKSWDDSITVYNPDGIDFIIMSYEQLTVYASFISRTTICASKETIKVEDKTDDDFVYVTYEGQKFHE